MTSLWWAFLCGAVGSATGISGWVCLSRWTRRRRIRTWLGTDPTKPFYVYRREGPGRTETIIRPATAVQVIKGGKTPAEVRRRPWMAPRSGGYRPGGDFTPPRDPATISREPPPGGGGVAR